MLEAIGIVALCTLVGLISVAGLLTTAHAFSVLVKGKKKELIFVSRFLIVEWLPLFAVGVYVDLGGCFGVALGPIQIAVGDFFSVLVKGKKK